MMICELPNDILLIIYKRYMKKLNLYYCNLGLVSKKMYNILGILCDNSKYKKFILPYNDLDNYRKLEIKTMRDSFNLIYKLNEYKLNSIYYVRSKKYNIKFVKLYFIKMNLYNFGLIYGDEGLLFSFIKYINESKQLELLKDFEYIII